MKDIPEDPPNADPLTRYMPGQLNNPEQERAGQISSAMKKGLAKTCVNRCLMWTTSGRLGIGTSTAKPLDVIVALKDGGTPFVLRSQGDHFIPTGQRYADGIMRERWLPFWKDKTEDHLFDIR